MLLAVHRWGLMVGVGRICALVGTVFGCAVLGAGVASADGPVQVRSRLGDFCLDGPGVGWNVWAVINPCNGSDFQRWNLNGQQLESVAYPGQCLTDVADLDSAGGDPVRLEPCYDPGSLAGQYQSWDIQPDGHVVVNDGSCLFPYGDPGPGIPVAVTGCSGDPGQGWDSVR